MFVFNFFFFLYHMTVLLVHTKYAGLFGGSWNTTPTNKFQRFSNFMVDMSYFYCVLSQFDIASEL